MTLGRRFGLALVMRYLDSLSLDGREGPQPIFVVVCFKFEVDFWLEI